MSLTINNKLNFIDNFTSLVRHQIVKILTKDDFKYISQEFGNNVLELVKQKGFYPYECRSDFEKLKEGNNILCSSNSKEIDDN